MKFHLKMESQLKEFIICFQCNDMLMFGIGCCNCVCNFMTLILLTSSAVSYFQVFGFAKG